MQTKSAGFTLIELMIVVVIIAILASIALPAYQNHITKTRRVTAGTCLLEHAQFAERYRTTNMSYAGLDGAMPDFGCAGDLTGHYTFDVAVASATAFNLTATPQGSQATRDTLCATLSVDQTGKRSAGDGAAETVRKCF